MAGHVVVYAVSGGDVDEAGSVFGRDVLGGDDAAGALRERVPVLNCGLFQLEPAAGPQTGSRRAHAAELLGSSREY